MPIFRLYESKRKAMPDTITVDGIAFPINPSFRNILRIIVMLGDNDTPDFFKPHYLQKWFYPVNYPANPWVGFASFVTPSQKSNKESINRQPDFEPDWDLEFDADEIYTSFLQQYGLDLYESDMHWYKFLALLSGLGENTAFQRKIQIRNADLSGFKGKSLAKMMAAKEAAQLPAKYTRQELEEIAEFDRVWGE